MSEHADRWPRLMRRETAAAYCDMSPEQFDRHCPIPAKDQGWRGLRWDRAALDRWVDNMPDRGSKAVKSPANALDDRGHIDADVPAPTPEERRQASLARI